jgi:hypothetical protein
VTRHILNGEPLAVQTPFSDVRRTLPERMPKKMQALENHQRVNAVR